MATLHSMQDLHFLTREWTLHWKQSLSHCTAWEVPKIKYSLIFAIEIFLGLLTYFKNIHGVYKHLHRPHKLFCLEDLSRLSSGTEQSKHMSQSIMYVFLGLVQGKICYWTQRAVSRRTKYFQKVSVEKSISHIFEKSQSPLPV